MLWRWIQPGAHPEQRQTHGPSVVPDCAHVFPSVWAGVVGSSCPADSQQLVWCEQQFSDHLLAVSGAGSTPLWHVPPPPGGTQVTP